MPQKVSRAGLWISAILIILLDAVQGWSGGWAAFYLIWPGYVSSNTFLSVVVGLASYHIRMGIVIIVISLLIIIFTFLVKTNLYVRILAVAGLIIQILAALGGYHFVTSGFQDRLSLGQMADSFIGAFAAYFLLLLFMNRVPRFPWTPASNSRGKQLH